MVRQKLIAAIKWTETRACKRLLSTLLVFGVLLMLIVPYAYADDDEMQDTSFYKIAAIASAYLSTEIAKGNSGYSITQNSSFKEAGDAGGLLGYSDAADESGLIAGWVASALSASSATFSYKGLANSKFGDGTNGRPFYIYAQYGNLLRSIGFDQTAAEMGFSIRGIAGGLMKIFYAACTSSTAAFSFVTSVLKMMNPFRFINTTSTNALGQTIFNVGDSSFYYAEVAADGSIFTSGGSSLADTATDSLSTTLTRLYHYIRSTWVPIIVAMFLLAFVVSVLLKNGKGAGSKAKRFLMRLCVLVLAVPLCATVYTSCLNALSQDLQADNSAATRAVLSVFIDFERWAERYRLGVSNIPSGNRGYVHLELEKKGQSGAYYYAPSDATINSLRDTCYYINLMSGVTSSRAVSSDEDKAFGDVAAPVANASVPDVTVVKAVQNLLDRYSDGDFYYSSDYEMYVKSSVSYSGYYEKLIKASTSTVNKFKSDVANSPGTYGNVWFWDGGALVHDASSVTSDIAAGSLNYAFDGGTTKNTGLSTMAMYNYLTSTFSGSNLVVYSNEKAASGFVRESHYSVNLIGGNMVISFLYYINTISLLITFAVLAWFYAFAIIIGSIRKAVLMMLTIPFAMLGSMRSAARLVTYTIVMVVEIVVSMFAYVIVCDILMAMNGFFETLFTTRSAGGVVIAILDTIATAFSGEMWVILKLIILTIVNIVFLIMALKVRKTMIKFVSEMVQDFVDKLFGVRNDPMPDSGSSSARMAGAMGAGVGAAVGAKLAGGGGGSSSHSDTKGTSSGGGSESEDKENAETTEGGGGDAAASDVPALGAGEGDAAGGDSSSNTTVNNSDDDMVSFNGDGHDSEDAADKDAAAALDGANSLDDAGSGNGNDYGKGKEFEGNDASNAQPASADGSANVDASQVDEGDNAQVDAGADGADAGADAAAAAAEAAQQGDEMEEAASAKAEKDAKDGQSGSDGADSGEVPVDGANGSDGGSSGQDASGAEGDGTSVQSDGSASGESGEGGSDGSGTSGSDKSGSDKSGSNKDGASGSDKSGSGKDGASGSNKAGKSGSVNEAKAKRDAKKAELEKLKQQAAAAGIPVDGKSDGKTNGKTGGDNSAGKNGKGKQPTAAERKAGDSAKNRQKAAENAKREAARSAAIEGATAANGGKPLTKAQKVAAMLGADKALDSGMPVHTAAYAGAMAAHGGADSVMGGQREAAADAVMKSVSESNKASDTKAPVSVGGVGQGSVKTEGAPDSGSMESKSGVAQGAAYQAAMEANGGRDLTEKQVADMQAATSKALANGATPQEAAAAGAKAAMNGPVSKGAQEKMDRAIARSMGASSAMSSVGSGQMTKSGATHQAAIAAAEVANGGKPLTPEQRKAVMDATTESMKKGQTGSAAAVAGASAGMSKTGTTFNSEQMSNAKSAAEGSMMAHKAAVIQSAENAAVAANGGKPLTASQRAAVRREAAKAYDSGKTGQDAAVAGAQASLGVGAKLSPTQKMAASDAASNEFKMQSQVGGKATMTLPNGQVVSGTLTVDKDGSSAILTNGDGGSVSRGTGMAGSQSSSPTRGGSGRSIAKTFATAALLNYMSTSSNSFISGIGHAGTQGMYAGMYADYRARRDGQPAGQPSGQHDGSGKWGQQDSDVPSEQDAETIAEYDAETEQLNRQIQQLKQKMAQAKKKPGEKKLGTDAKDRTPDSF